MYLLINQQVRHHPHEDGDSYEQVRVIITQTAAYIKKKNVKKLYFEIVCIIIYHLLVMTGGLQIKICLWLNPVQCMKWKHLC